MKADGLQIKQDLQFQNRAWKVRRFFWAAMLMLVLAGALGFLGPGPLGRATAGRPGDALTLEYRRLERAQAPPRLVFHAAAPAGGALRLWLSSAHLDSVKVERINPQPAAVIAGGGRVQFPFRTRESPQPITVTFHLKPDRCGRLKGQAGADGSPPLRFRQLIYP